MSRTIPAPPAAPTEPFVRELHGTRLVDPYRWMKDRADPRLRSYLAAERAHYDAVMGGYHEIRTALGAEIAALLPVEEDSVPFRRGEYRYVEHMPVGAEYGQLLRQPLDGDEYTVVLDADAVAAGHEYLRYGACQPSPDGRYLAYSVDFTGEEVYELRFRDTVTGLDLAERIPHTYYGSAWSQQSTVYFYVTHDRAYRPYQVYRHTIGTDPRDDVLVFAEEDERHHVQVRATRSGAWVVISSDAADTNEQWLVPAGAPENPARLVEPRRRGIEYFAEHLVESDELVLLTNDGAPEYRVVRAPLANPGRAGWTEVVPGAVDTRIRQLDVFAGYLVLRCQRDGTGSLRVIRPDGTSYEHGPQDPCGIIELDRPDPYDTTSLVVSTESLVVPRRWWRIDLATGALQPLRQTSIPGYDPAAYAAERGWATAPDGERIPVTFAYRIGAVGGPCVLYGYGAYERCIQPRFSPTQPSLLDRGYVYAIAHVRGGGEGGRRWWLKGRLGHKHHTFSDFVAVRDWLVQQGWAAPDRVVCRGLSAGGLVTGAAYTFWPDRWAGVIAEVPAVDLLNQMLDPTVPLTVNEYDEWGDPTDPEQFGWMRAYSPYENLADGPKPPLLVTASMFDPRVAVYEPAKWVAALRALDTHGNDILLRAALGAGAHKGPSGRLGSLAYEAELLAWIVAGPPSFAS